MERFRLPLLMAVLVLGGCQKEPEAPPPATNAPASAPASGNPVTAPVDYLGGIAKGKRSAEKVVDAASLNQAVQLFYAQEGRYPKSLNELVSPDYLPKLPTPPRGMKFDYNPQIGRVKVVPQ